MEFEQTMPHRRDEELQRYLDNYTKYVPDAIKAAFEELKKRGREFSEDETVTIENKIAHRRTELAKEENNFEHAAYDKNIVTDDAGAPMLYSQNAIAGFSLFITSLAGAILLYHNLKNTDKRKEANIVLTFGIAYTITGIVALNMIGQNAAVAMLFNLIGVLLINKVLWPKFVGAETEYNAKPIWKPLIIWVLVMIPFVLAFIYAPK